MGRGRRRIGWLGWTLALLLVAAAAIGAFVGWAFQARSVASLDRLDSWYPRPRAIRLAATAQYGPRPRQKLELFVPRGKPPPGGFPLVGFLHGGNWDSGDPHDYGFVARTLGERGYATALLGYRLVPEGRYPAMLEDGAAALRWLADHAAAHGVAADRIALIGHSAGAYNAAMLALDRRWLRREGLPDDTIAGVVGLAGPYDFYPWTSAEARAALGRWPDPAETQPVRHVRADAPPILLLHGTADTSVRPRQSRALLRAGRAAGAPVEARFLEGVGHGGVLLALSRPFEGGGQVERATVTFLDRVLSAPVQPARTKR